MIEGIELIGNELPWLSDVRRKGREAFKLPTPKDEAWKYTKLRELSDLTFRQTSQKESISEISLPDFDCYTVSFVNGIFDPLKSNLPDSCEVVPLIEKLIEGSGCQCAKALNEKEEPICLADDESYPFLSLNNAYLQEGVYVELFESLNKPLVILHHAKTAEQLYFNLRNIISIKDNVKADILEVYSYEGEMKSLYFGNYVTEIKVGRHAKLNHYKLQKEAFYAYHIALSLVDVFEKGSYNGFCLQLGSHIGRNETVVSLREKEAETSLNSAYMMNGWATLDTTTDIRHLAPYTTSNQLIKGVVGGNARGVFCGKIHIAKNAIKTSGNQLHKTMLLSDTAEVDTKPELEIFADDVKCSHGSASGALDEDQMFYMQSRGISEETAKQILIDAYLNEVISKVENQTIREWIKANV